MPGVRDADERSASEPLRLGPELIGEALAELAGARPVRRRFGGGGRLHLERPLPFLCLHALGGEEIAAREIVTSSASYLLAPDMSDARALANALAAANLSSANGFALVDVGELPEDRLLEEDSPRLPPFELRVAISAHPAMRVAAHAFVEAVERVDVKYRSPRIAPIVVEEKVPPGLDPDIATLRIRFAPIYRHVDGRTLYPELRERIVVHLFDAILQALAAFIAAADTGPSRVAVDTPPDTPIGSNESADVASGARPARARRGDSALNHRALGRGICADAVYRVDRKIDEVARSFDFLSTVTPINSAEALERFRAARFERAPRFLYRPLSIDTTALKHSLHAIRLEYLEDPVLVGLYREKQHELDLKITLLALRDTPPFRDASRLLYGSVTPTVLEAAREILDRTAESPEGSRDEEETIGCAELEIRAREMIGDYAARHAGFDAEVVIRDDLPPGMMVSGPRLMIARSTRMRRGRVNGLLHHEIGVHLLTGFNGDAQGLALLRSGLAGYEGTQEGLAVLAEHLVGDLSRERLRLIAARVVGCAAMLDGATFVDVFRLACKDHGFTPERAFQLALRLFRSGGLAKDAIYLSGLLEILAHLRAGTSLDIFWIGKIASRHLPIMQELAARGLVKPAPLKPLFLEHADALPRLAAARVGVSPLDLITDQDP